MPPWAQHLTPRTTTATHPRPAPRDRLAPQYATVGTLVMPACGGCSSWGSPLRTTEPSSAACRPSSPTGGSGEFAGGVAGARRPAFRPMQRGMHRHFWEGLRVRYLPPHPAPNSKTPNPHTPPPPPPHTPPRAPPRLTHVYTTSHPLQPHHPEMQPSEAPAVLGLHARTAGAGGRKHRAGERPRLPARLRRCHAAYSTACRPCTLRAFSCALVDTPAQRL